MVSNGDKNFKSEIQEDISAPKSCNNLSLEPQSLSETKNPNPILNFLKSIQIPIQTKPKFTKFTHSPSTKFLQIAQNRDFRSRSIKSESPIPNSPHIPNSPQNPNSSQNPNSHPHLELLKNIDWPHVWSLTKTWFKDPLNLALFIWILCVAISGAILFLVMTGMLNKQLPKKSQRDTWFEINNQILNALFTLMCLYQHPKRIYHFILLMRYSPKDILTLRKTYCKNGTYKPHEWAHIMVVVFLLNLNCFAQYALCGLNLGFPRSKRPAIGVGICISVAIGAPAFAGLYNAISPLGKDYDYDLEAQKLESIGTSNTGTNLGKMVSLERKYSFVQAQNIENMPNINEDIENNEIRPVWVGGILDFWDDISLAYLSIFCSFCVFGWNMQRLGFGNMYVHIITFILFCSAPFFIFNLAAVNINNEALRESLGLTGVVLCFLGLLYGGFWRIQMRKRFKLPGSEFFCFGPSTLDCLNWLCCCWCSLAQEVRTAEYYHISEDKTSQTDQTSQMGQMESPLGNNNRVMKAPVPSVIEKDDESVL